MCQAKDRASVRTSPSGSHSTARALQKPQTTRRSAASGPHRAPLGGEGRGSAFDGGGRCSRRAKEGALPFCEHKERRSRSFRRNRRRSTQNGSLLWKTVFEIRVSRHVLSRERSWRAHLVAFPVRHARGDALDVRDVLHVDESRAVGREEPRAWSGARARWWCAFHRVATSRSR